MTDQLRQAAQQALEAWDDPAGMKDLCVAMDAIRTTLEQQQAEPSQWRDMVVVSLVRESVNKHKARELADHFATLFQQQAEPVLQTCNCRWDGDVQVQQCTLHEAHVDAIHEWAERAKVAERKLEQQAEPVACVACEGRPKGDNIPCAICGAAQRQWVGLTDEDLEFWTGELGQGELGRGVIRAVADKLKERNT